LHKLNPVTLIIVGNTITVNGYNKVNKSYPNDLEMKFQTINPGII